MKKTDSLNAFYNDLSQETTPKEAVNSNRLQCKRGCADCCVDEMTVFEVEAQHIVTHCQDVLKTQHNPIGKCAFLDGAGACRIYAHRPYVCRTQGLPLRWFDEMAGQMVEFRDICPLNETSEPLQILPADSCWEIGPFEGRLATLQVQVGGENLKRVLLRSLFYQAGE